MYFIVYLISNETKNDKITHFKTLKGTVIPYTHLKSSHTLHLIPRSRGNHRKSLELRSVKKDQ